MNKLVWSEPAVSDLDAIHAYISHDAAVYADAVVLELLDTAESLIQFPDAGRRVPELQDSQTRELIIGNYRLMYEIQGEIIHILTVLHGARHVSH